MVPVHSFRDPTGSCWLLNQTVVRVVAPEHARELDAFLQSPIARRWMEERRLVASRKLGTATEREAVRTLHNAPAYQEALTGEHLYEHERIYFPAYPCEWPPEMLHAAAELTLALALEARPEGYGLKDATPYNVLFSGPQPVFIDLPSFERRVPADPTWKPYAQFVRTFLLPLLANRQWGMPLADVFGAHRDGLEPESVYRWCHPLQRLLPPFLGLVSLPAWLSVRKESEQMYRDHLLANSEKAQFVLEMALHRLRRALARVQPRRGKASTWSDYMETHSYSEPSFGAKESFVREALSEARPRHVLDVGANTGHFSEIAAGAGAAVVAIDSDPGCVGNIWQRAREKTLNILPLVVDFARPTPALGWRNRECPSFLERAQGRFDCVLMLAVLHHLLVTERVPLDEVLALASELTTGYLLIEFVAPQDAMFRRLARGRDHLHAGLDVHQFEHACRRHFDVLRSIRLGESHRWLYWLRKTGTPT